MWKAEITEYAEKDLEWFKKHDKKLYGKCFDLLRDILKDPEKGIGKPEKLKYQHQNLSSRRVSLEHRAVYIVDLKVFMITFLAFRRHYGAIKDSF